VIKILISTVLIFTLYAVINIRPIITDNKVIYELADYSRLSVNDSGGNELSNDIMIRVKLDVDDFDGNNNGIDQSDKRGYRALAKDYYSTLNKNFVNDIELPNYKDIYISKYSPYILYTYDRNEFNKYENLIVEEINDKSYIETAYIKEHINNEYKENVSGTMYLAGAWDQWNNNYYTGAGIVVGVLEPGLVDASQAIFNDISVTVLTQNVPGEGVHEHSTAMAGYIARSGGVAKEASILSAYLYGVMDEEIEWMLDNDVDIINMSFGELVPTGIYDSDAAYADYIVNQYKVTVVAAAGNEGEGSGYVCNPSLGYNVISLGAANDGVARSPYSSYLEAEGSAPKPTLVLVGSYVANIPLDVMYSGTSVSSACASGIIALLMEQHPNLKTNPERLQALLCSSARMHPYAVLLDNGFNEPTGAGMIHYENFNTQYANSYTIMNYNGRSGSIIHTRTVELTGGTRFKCSIAWTAYATGDVSRTKFTNYNIYLKDSEGNILAVANSTNSCIELITCIIPEDGTYKIEIEQIGTIKKINEKIGVAYGTAADYEM
jgi:hypothetical protein